MENTVLIDDVINKDVSRDISEKIKNTSFLSCFNEDLRGFFCKDGITEIMINGTDCVYIEQNGFLSKLDIKVCELDIRRFIDAVSHINSRNIDYNHPVFDGKLPGGFRCNIVMPPVSLNGVVITIRKHTQSINDFKTLIKNKMLDENTATMLTSAIRDKQNIIVAGGAGTGKTTLVNVLFNALSFLDCTHERVITIEDTAELRLELPHVIRLESRFPTPDCPFELTIRDLVKTALRMRPDRIVIGEVRGEEAYDLLHAVNTGHKGTVCTHYSRKLMQGCVKAA